ncbi:MAG: NAD-dependent epimerase/dehydratase family protein [Ruminococcus sp.]|jgi:dTDP-glucose 4,6-dehydratase|nr:NAD-dependent epimerase/dehydratase family protein [Ruminococcus sp.]
MQKILITGGTTFVSRFTAEYYASKGNEVYVINRNSKAQVNGVKLIDCDRTKLGNRLKGTHFDVVLDVTAYTEEHVKTLLNALASFDDYIFISSSAVYPETNPQPFSENQPCGKNSVWGDYGTNKLDAEKYLLNNLPSAYILRPPYFYGVYENLYREPFVFDCAEKDRPFYIPENGEMKLQFFNVKDLCRFIDILLEKHPENKIFNLGNRETATIKDWVTLCYKAVGKAPEFLSVGKSVNQRDYFCFYDYEYTLDVSKQYELMPSTVSLEQGLKEEYEWYKSNHNAVNKKPYIEFIENNL